MDRCPCGSDSFYQDCCQTLINGSRLANTAEELLRSRYSAYVKNEIDYIIKTTHPHQKNPNDEKTIRQWAKKSQWNKFKIIEVLNGGITDSVGKIEFIVDYTEKDIKKKHHEIAEFKKENGQWYFFDGKSPAPKQYIRTNPKIGRNDLCPCGSGKKYKKCCFQKEEE